MGSSATDGLRAAVLGDGRTAYAISKAIGVPQSHLTRFLRHGGGISLETGVKLARVVGYDFNAVQAEGSGDGE